MKPPPLVLNRVPRRTVQPPPLPKRFIAYVTSIDKNSSTLIWSVVALLIVVVLAGTTAYRSAVTIPAQQAIVAEQIARFAPIKEAVLRANDNGSRQLSDSVSFRRVYIQNAHIIRYQIDAHHLQRAELQPYISFTTEKAKFLSTISKDAHAEPALRLASSIYVDVYDREGEFLYSYDLRPSHLWPGAIDPTPIE